MMNFLLNCFYPIIMIDLFSVKTISKIKKKKQKIKNEVISDFKFFFMILFIRGTESNATAIGM